MDYAKYEEKDTGIVIVKEECSLEFEEIEFEDYVPEEFGEKVIKQLFALQNVSAETNGPKVSKRQNEHSESSQIIIKEEIDCDIENGSEIDLDSLHSADEVPAAVPTVRRSSRRRCPRFSLDELWESTSDEGTVCKCGKKVCNGHSRQASTRRGLLPEDCEVCGKSFEQFCNVCGRGFSRLGYLRRHLGTHSKSKRYTCSRCGKSFSRSDNLKDHERLHRGETFRCDVCGKEFSQPGHLKQHERLHSGDRPYRCDVCGKAFRVRGYLVDHTRIHTGERPYACRVCGKAFTQAPHLRVHARSHTGERRHGCEVCGKLFIRRTHLKLHLRVHRGRGRQRQRGRGKV